MPKAETLEDAHVIQALAKVEQQWGALADCAWGRPVTGESFFGGWGMQSCTASLSIDQNYANVEL